MKACPLCQRQGTLLLVVTAGFWERFVLSPLGWRPFRCRACGNRIVRRQSTASEAATRGSAEASPERPIESPPEAGFLPPRDEQPFDALIRQLAQSEEAQGLRAAQAPPSSHDSQPPQDPPASQDRPSPRAKGRGPRSR